MFRNFPFACSLLACALLVGNLHAAERDLAELEEQSLRAAVEYVAPSVVKIETVGGLEKVEGMLVGLGATTGLIVSPDGYVISSAFNFVQQPSSILVTLPDGTRSAAKVVARDHSRMLVLLKVATKTELPVPTPVPAEEMRVGQWAIAVGRTFEGSRPNVSVGIVSALGRMSGRAVQTDAKISPNNYGGPLLDIRGRVFGVLVPMSPQATTEVAGFEWYDGGIGFAIPLTDILAKLDSLKTGHDLYRGLLGIGLKSGDPYSQPALIASAREKSPAREAGFKQGDIIVEVDGQPIQTAMQLQIQMGKRYAGDKVHLVAQRANAKIEGDVLLVEKLPPYQDPFLGLLPLRGLPEKPATGVVVRYVYPASPAAAAGMQIGDRIVQLGEVKFSAIKLPPLKVVPLAMAAHAPGDKVKLVVLRDNKQMEFELIVTKLPTAIPGDLPPARAETAEEDANGKDADEEAAEPADNAEPATTQSLGVSEWKLPEFPNVCRMYVPENYKPEVPHGILLWLHASGGDEPSELFARWSALCKANDLILLAPQATDVVKWSPTDSEFVMKCLETASARYRIDPSRVVAHGYQAGGAMAYYLAFAHRDTFTGVAAIDAPLPGMGKIADNEPGKRLSVFAGTCTNARFAERIAASLTALRAAEYPVTVKELGAEPRYLQADELTELVRWIDALDRF
jgi:serine protease Do